jgi:hypothetical protein
MVMVKGVVLRDHRATAAIIAQLPLSCLLKTPGKA